MSKTLKQFINENTSKNVEYDSESKPHTLVYGQYQLGSVTFGSSTIGRAMLIDESWSFDKKMAGNMPFARMENPMTKIKGGHVSNATIAKFKPETGMMWLGEDEDENGNTVWSRPFKYKKIIIQSSKLADRAGWSKYL